VARILVNIEQGDFVEIEVVEGRAVLTPKRLVDKDQAYFWSREWQEAEREAEEDIRAGRVKEFASAEESIRDLEE
jgi:bifunctional DNA-binding transcriptional regulator/antitoxin component of YhaV-PrlF toxin-antitoxin module